MQDKLVELLNELLEDAKPSTRKLIGQLLTGSDGTFTNAVEWPDDLIVSAPASQLVGKDRMVRVSMLGILNTALQRSGESRRIIAVVDDDGFLQRVELGPYPPPK